MRGIKNLVLVFIAVGVLAALFNANPALATDGAAQTQSFIKSIVTTLVGLAGAVAVVFMVIGGFHYITSSGHPEKLDKAKKTLLYSGVGLVIVLAAYTIVDFVAGIAKSSFGN
jgi:type IV secretory pathway VirB2 component (pilin)